MTMDKIKRLHRPKYLAAAIRVALLRQGATNLAG